MLLLLPTVGLAVFLAVKSAEPKPHSNSQILLLKYEDSHLASFFGHDLRQTTVTRNSDGTSLYFHDEKKSEIDVFNTNGFVKTIALPSRKAFINDAGEVVAWEQHPDFYFKNGTVLRQPKPGWEDIKDSVVRTSGGKFYLKDGTVTDFKAFPMHTLSVEYSGKFCVYEVGDTESIFEIGDKTNRLVATQTNFSIHPWCKCIFSFNGKIFLFGQRREPRDKTLRALIFSPQGTNYALEKEVLLPDVFVIEDMDFSSERIIADHPRDYFGDIFYLYDLSDGKKKRIGTGYSTAVFLRKELKEKTGLK